MLKSREHFLTRETIDRFSNAFFFIGNTLFLIGPYQNLRCSRTFEAKHGLHHRLRFIFPAAFLEGCN